MVYQHQIARSSFAGSETGGPDRQNDSPGGDGGHPGAAGPRGIRTESKRLLLEDLMAIAHHCASLPALDTWIEDEIMGWDENGLPS
jgi:hypothetical protein